MEHPEDNTAYVWKLLAEAEALAKQRHGCHHTRNDLGAAILIGKMFAEGMDVSLATLEGCVERIRIAVVTGDYPQELLEQARRKGEAVP